MHIVILGPGRIGGNIARRLAPAGHEITLAFSRDTARLADLATEIGARVGAPSQAAAAEVVVLAVPWGVIDQALEQAGPLTGRVVIDTTNQFGRDGVARLGGRTAARYNAERMPGARYAKCFNTLTAAFQAAAAGRGGAERVVQWIASDDTGARDTVAALVRDAGYAPVYLGGIDECAVMEAPRRPGAVYGEEYREADALAVVRAIRAGRPIPPTPAY